MTYLSPEFPSLGTIQLIMVNICLWIDIDHLSFEVYFLTFR
jgi:hypothetical protein